MQQFPPLSSTLPPLFHFEALLAYKDLEAVPCHDNCEPMVSLPADILHGSCRHPLVRTQVVERLLQAQKLLAQYECGLRLEVLSAYRPLKLQTEMFESVVADVVRRNPRLTGESLYEEAHKFVAVPTVAPHPTGAAVDVTLLTEEGLAPLDMGTEYLQFDAELIPTFASGVTEQQREHRMLLRLVMMSAGFAPYNGEWWHFSYGDREWAAFYGKEQSLYGPVEVDVTCSVDTAA